MENQKPNRLIVILLVLILVALVMDIGVGVYALVDRGNRTEALKTQVEAKLTSMEAMTGLSETQIINYQNAAYDSGLDRIAEQQLVATEFQMLETVNLVNQVELLGSLIATIALGE